MTYVPEINWKHYGECYPIWRDIRDIVNVDCQFAQVSPIAGVVPVGPESDVFQSSILTDSGAITVGSLDSRSGYYTLEAIVKAEPNELLEDYILRLSKPRKFTDGGC